MATSTVIISNDKSVFSSNVADLNNCLYTGEYRYGTETLNIPSAMYGICCVHSTNNPTSTGTGWTWQIAYTTTGEIYFRRKINVGGSWTSWIEIDDTSGTTNGIYWKKCGDGTLIQSGKITSISFNNEAFVEGTVTLPVSFDGSGYSVVANAASTSNNDYIMRVTCNASSGTVFAWTMGSGSGSAITVSNRQLNWIAFGRWQ